MLIKYLLATIVAGLFAGILVTPAMYLRTVPLILHAETFEDAEGGHDHGAGEAAHSHESAEPHEHETGPELPFGRLGNTILANLVAGAGFALALGGVALLLGRRITARNGIYWGLAGFFVFAFAPSLGLAPELPAMPAADLGSRQVWWVATVLLSAIGLYLIALRREAWARPLGLAVIVAPHLYGAPKAEDLSSPVPAVLASEYAVASLATNLFMWAVLGLALGWMLQRYASAELEG
ncbi:CbtA family protein [Phyllobacterium leguminum]|uniref:Cobalt transporter subunit CbtA n=1 Tax=Phyllobacterium leguminum TaxID=314237 RepID=A0A318TAH5_9HYPH|nr:CbtA family protein [Phyllobacterium leguminum]PYE90036.1 cobalt transporter subunit CbtA [Phyllobacterium leguminum]